jgi:hypothetical protein
MAQDVIIAVGTDGEAARRARAADTDGKDVPWRGRHIRHVSSLVHRW